MTHIIALAALAGLGAPASPSIQNPGKNWSISADYIEACSCHLFCACYFATSPEGGEFCEFNNAIKIAKGHVGKVNVDGCKVWLSGDLGGDFSKGHMKTAVITFDKGTSASKKEALKFLVGKIYPVKWENFSEDEAPIAWQRTGMNGVAKLGNKAMVQLTGAKDSSGKQSVIKNLTYWGAQKNNGFELAYSKHFYKANGLDYKYDRNNGFFIHIESSGAGEK